MVTATNGCFVSLRTKGALQHNGILGTRGSTKPYLANITLCHFAHSHNAGIAVSWKHAMTHNECFTPSLALISPDPPDRTVGIFPMCSNSEGRFSRFLDEFIWRCNLEGETSLQSHNSHVTSYSFLHQLKNLYWPNPPAMWQLCSDWPVSTVSNIRVGKRSVRFKASNPLCHVGILREGPLKAIQLNFGRIPLKEISQLSYIQY